jgi:hypothetical protein
VLRDASTESIGFDQPMAERDCLRVMLELEVGSEPIVGNLQSHAKRLDFSGWIGLATALEEMIRTATDATTNRHARPEGTHAGSVRSL